MVKDLSAFAAPALDIALRPGRKVTIYPPSVKDGAALASIVTLGSAIGQGKVSDATVEMFQSTTEGMSEEDVKRLAVGDRYDWMVEQGWSWTDIETVCMYATYYWVFGERVADQIMAADQDQRQGKQAGPGKRRGRGRNGRRTA
jgi:hypothetical protein